MEHAHFVKHCITPCPLLPEKTLPIGKVLNRRGASKDRVLGGQVRQDLGNGCHPQTHQVEPWEAYPPNKHFLHVITISHGILRTRAAQWTGSIGEEGF